MKKIVQLALLMSLANITTSHCEASMRSIEERNMLSDQNEIRIDATKKIIAILEANLAEEKKENNELRENLVNIYDKYSIRDRRGFIRERLMPNDVENKFDKLTDGVNLSNELIEFHEKALNKEEELLKRLVLQSEDQYGITYLD